MAPPHPRRGRGAASDPDRDGTGRRAAAADRLRLSRWAIRQALPQRLTGEARAQAVWRWLAGAITDTPDNRNNRFAVAAAINASFAEGPGPFWSHPTGQLWPGLPFRRAGIDYAALGLAETRAAEAAVPRAKSPWMLFNPGSVGSQSLLGLPLIHRLCAACRRGRLALRSAGHAGGAGRGLPLASGRAGARFWPMPRGFPPTRRRCACCPARFTACRRRTALRPCCSTPRPRRAEEGWILGAGHAALLAEALAWP